MNERDNFLLHAAKHTIRRLRMSSDRLTRNSLLSSMNFIDAIDIE